MGSLHRQRERERREMYLLLILLVSPAFGRPSSDQLDVGADISNELDDIVDFSKETGKLLNNSKLFGKVSESLKDAQQNILEMELELKSLQSEFSSLQKEKNYFPEFNEAKRYLRETRQELRELAHRTVKEEENVRILLDDLDSGKEAVLLQLTIDRMRLLMKETQERLEEGKQKYILAHKVFENLISSVKLQGGILDKEVAEEYQKFRLDKDYTEGVRKTCKWLSWFTFGLCSLIHHFENEVPLEKARVENEKLQAKRKKLSERTETLNADIGAAIGIMTVEIELINKWANSAERVSKNIDDYPEEYLRKYETIRTAFRNGLNDLKNVAKKFLAQPINIL